MPSRTTGISATTSGLRATLSALRGLVPPSLIVVLSLALFGLVSLYSAGLRDPRFLDGWILAAAIGGQLAFHGALKLGRLAPKAFRRWRGFHIFLGYLAIAAFVSHCDFSLPDTELEWALWTAFVLVTASGIFGAYLDWSLKTKGRVDDRVPYERIPERRAELARELQAIVSESDTGAVMLLLPGLPHDDWIADLYSAHLRAFFQAGRNLSSHLVGSQRPLKRLTDEIDRLSRYVDQANKEKLTTIKALVIEKDRLDFARVYLGLSKAWLFVHVPATYALVVLGVLHAVTAYAFTSGGW